MNNIKVVITKAPERKENEVGQIAPLLPSVLPWESDFLKIGTCELVIAKGYNWRRVR